jgi:thiol-disulfide isomerase/thioredoxin
MKRTTPRVHVRRIVLVVVTVVALFLAWSGTAAQSTAPEFSFADLSGKPHSLAEYRGKVVVLNFWATWCLPCREEMPMLNKLAAENLVSGKVVFLAVSLDDATTQAKIPKFLDKKKITLPVFTGATNATLTEFGLASVVPGTVILNPEGGVEFRIIGEASKKDVMSRVEWLLSDRSGKKPKGLQKNL